MGLNESSNNFVSLPPEMKITFEKMISQLDLIGKTMKIFDQRIQNLEGHITTISNRYKKNFVQKQPPQMGDYQYLMENSGSNYLPNNSIRNNNEDYQKYTNLNNLDYYTGEIYNPGSTFKDAMNINEENKKNMFKTEIEIKNENEINNNNGNAQYMGQLHEEYGYNNLGENEQEPQNEQEGNNEQYEEEQGEEYEEMQGQEEEQYDNEEQYEEQYEEGNYGEEEQIEQMEEYQEEQENGEEEIQYDDNEEQNNGQENNNNEQETPK